MPQAPPIVREPIFKALFDLLSTAVPAGSPQFVTKGRRLRIWDEVDAADQPALFLVQGPMVASQQHFGLTKWEMKATAWIYFRAEASPDPAYYPAKTINDYVDAVEAALTPDPLGPTQTLGKLVVHCWIDGPVVFDEGVTDGQAVIVIPVTVLTAI